MRIRFRLAKSAHCHGCDYKAHGRDQALLIEAAERHAGRTGHETAIVLITELIYTPTLYLVPTAGSMPELEMADGQVWPAQ